MTANIKVPNLNVLNGLQNHKNNEIAYVVDIDAYYQYKDDEGWVEKTPNLTVYDLNKQVVNQFNNFSEEEIETAKQLLRDWKKRKGTIFLMFGKEIGFIKIFAKQVLAAKAFEDTVMNVLLDYFDGVKNVVVEDDDTIGIWVDYEGDPTYLRIIEWEEIIYNG